MNCGEYMLYFYMKCPNFVKIYEHSIEMNCGAVLSDWESPLIFLLPAKTKKLSKVIGNRSDITASFCSM